MVHCIQNLMYGGALMAAILGINKYLDQKSVNDLNAKNQNLNLKRWIDHHKINSNTVIGYYTSGWACNPQKISLGDPIDVTKNNLIYASGVFQESFTDTAENIYLSYGNNILGLSQNATLNTFLSILSTMFGTNFTNSSKIGLILISNVTYPSVQCSSSKRANLKIVY